MREKGLFAITAIALLSLVVFTAADAWGRARGGGSRGSRSYSAPAPASRPGGSLSGSSHLDAAPHGPTPGSSVAAAAGATARPPSTLVPPISRHAVLGGLTGFALGGAIGGLLFRGGGGAIGLLDLLLLGGGAFLLIRALRAPVGTIDPAYAGATAGARAGSMPIAGGDLPRSPGAEGRQAAPLDRGAVAATAGEAYRAVQMAIGLRDMGLVCDRLTPQVYEQLQLQCQALRRKRRHSRIGGIDVRATEVVEVREAQGTERVTVRLEGAIVDAVVDDTTGLVVEGSETAPRSFDERWVLTRPVGAARWKVAAIHAPEAAV